MNDKALTSLGFLCNTGSASNLTEKADVFTVTIVVKVEDHISLDNGSWGWVSGGIMFAQTKMWVGQMKLYALRDMVATYPPVSI